LPASATDSFLQVDEHRVSRLLSQLEEHLYDLMPTSLEECKTDRLLAFDAGSSGSKMLIFTKDPRQCVPLKAEDKSCSGVKFTPTMTKFVKQSLSKLFGLISMRGAAQPLDAYAHDYTEEIVRRLAYAGYPTSSGVCTFDNYIALATAGNRIVDIGMDQKAFEVFSGHISAKTSVSLPNVPGFNVARTISGTNEAWLEYKAAGVNIVSSGGASAQLAVELTPATYPAWVKMIKDLMGRKDHLVCNNQDNPLDFISVVDRTKTSFEELAECPKTVVEDGNCVGLFSFLAGPKAQGISGCRVTKISNDPLEADSRFHRIGGFDQTPRAFAEYLKEQVEKSAMSPEMEACGKMTKEEGGHTTMKEAMHMRGRCMDLIKKFAYTDYMFSLLMNFFKVNGPFTLTKAGNMILIKDMPTIMTLHDDENLPFTQLWGSQYIAALTENQVNVIATDKKVDWIKTAAELLGYTHECKIGVEQSPKGCEVEITQVAIQKENVENVQEAIRPRGPLSFAALVKLLNVHVDETGKKLIPDPEDHEIHHEAKAQVQPTATTSEKSDDPNNAVMSLLFPQK